MRINHFFQETVYDDTLRYPHFVRLKVTEDEFGKYFPKCSNLLFERPSLFYGNGYMLRGEFYEWFISEVGEFLIASRYDYEKQHEVISWYRRLKIAFTNNDDLLRFKLSWL